MFRLGKTALTSKDFMNTRILLLLSMVAVTHNQLMVSAAQTQTEASRKAGPATGYAPVTPPIADTQTVTKAQHDETLMKIARKTQGMSFGKIAMIDNPLERAAALYNFMNNARTHCHHTVAGQIGAYRLDAAFSDGTLQPVTNCACLYFPATYTHPVQINDQLAKLKQLLNYTRSSTVDIVPSVHSLVADAPGLAPDNLFVHIHPFSDRCHWCIDNQAQPTTDRVRSVTTPHDEDCLVAAPPALLAAPETPATSTPS